MRTAFLSALTGFVLGAILGGIGLKIAIHHVRQPLAESVHFAWYDWFMYLAWPGYTLVASLLGSVLKGHPTVTSALVILANGLILSLVFLGFYLGLQVVKIAYRKAFGES
jgi:hypothetical protein